MKKCGKIIARISLLALTGVVAAAGCAKILKDKAAVIPGGFTVTAHTGCEGTKDNSLEAIERGYNSGADVVEFDLSFTSQGEPVLEHDAPKADSVTLKQAFELVAKYEGLRVNVDVKTTENLKAVADTAKECGVLDRIFYTGIDTQKVAAVKTDTPEITYYLNTSIEKSKKNNEEYIRSLAALVKENGALGLNIHYSEASEKMVEIFYSEGLQVSVWTVNNEWVMHRILALGCDNITTRQPAKLIEIIESKR